MNSRHHILQACCVIVVLSATIVAQSLNEADALKAITLATNPTTKLTAAEDFIAKFPNSTARLSVAETIATELRKIKNGTVALALLERAQAIFKQDNEREIFKPVALEIYTIGNRPDDAFALAADLLAKNPDDVHVLMLITLVGTEEARKRNRKYSDISLQYGLKAIALLEANQKPPDVADHIWALQRGNLDKLYQQTAILYLAAGNTQEATVRLTKASRLSPRDPSNFALLARIINADYLVQNEAYEAMTDGKSKEETRKKLDTLLDSIIDAYARAAGLATGRVEYQALLQQVIPDLTAYYKYRNQSTKGLKQLIDRYRLAP
ncbi:MAG TPA: hypothetical protein VFI24_18460 [Pyrinomonadaceae bacterium]|nr:hypothetical protein [Pyrinomonadaceae bacterium]